MVRELELRERLLAVFTAILLAGLLALAVAGQAVAAPPSLLAEFPENTEQGAAADRIAGPTAVSVDPDSGALYVADNSNDRIVEFDAWGQFVRAIGWDVAPGAVDEMQELRVRATAGQFRLGFGASTTSNLPFDADAAEVEAALNALSSISGGGGAVSVSGGPGGEPGITPSVFYVTFDAGPLAGTDVEQITSEDGTVPLSGGEPNTLLTSRTLAAGTSAKAALEVCTVASECKAAIRGSAPGQSSRPNGLALDSAGNLYLVERDNARVQKLDPTGEFLLMFGGEVNKTSGADVCTAADLEGGDTCGEGVEGTADGYFEPPTSFARDYITVDDSDAIYVGDRDRIQVFDTGGAYVRQIPIPEAGNPGALEFDPATESLYFSLFRTSDTSNPEVHRLNPADGSVLGSITLEYERPGKVNALTPALDGTLFVAFDPNGAGEAGQARIGQFAANGEAEIGLDEAFGAPPVVSGIVAQITLTSMAASLDGNLYVGQNGNGMSAISAYGPPPLAYGPPPKVPPQILDQFAVAVNTASASLRATINPRFWADTTYYLEYGEVDCATGPCVQKPVPPGLTLTTNLVNAGLPTEVISVAGLAPDTTYHYRFVAQSSGGGPVTGEDRTFRTPRAAVSQPGCPNDAFRPDAGSFLPDCRAYEMVSPIDKAGADVSVVFTSSGYPAGLNQSSRDGSRLTYSAYRAFAGPEAAPYSSQYLSERSPSGWRTRAISPVRSGPSLYSVLGLDSQYRAFDDQLCRGWLLQDANTSLAPGSVADWPNYYRRQLCGDEAYVALLPASPPDLMNADQFQPQLQGVSADGETAIFAAATELDGADLPVAQLYRVDSKGPDLVCVYPNGTPTTGRCSAGTGPTGAGHRGGSVWNAISADGSRIYWTDTASGEGDIYVRIGDEETIAVSAGAARFWGAAADGSVALYSEGGLLSLFDLASETSEPIVEGFEGLMGMSEDGSKIYLASSQSLDAGSTAGEPNAYLYEPGEPGEFQFIATLSSDDLDGAAYSPVSETPVSHAAQVTPDGAAVAFMSVAPLTGVDNTDVNSGERDGQVFLYRAAADTLLCVSCNRTGARPSGRNVKGNYWASGLFPPPETQLEAPRVLSDNSKRLFFESFDPLSPRDTNHRRDVYQWEEVGSGGCTVQSAMFFEELDGCIDLISSGESPEHSFLVGSSADGADVFFKTESSLRPEDPGLVDIYDARAAGGFPLPSTPAPPCRGEACLNPGIAPAPPSTSSSVYVGPGNKAGGSAKKPRRCPKGKRKIKRKGKVRCVKKKGKRKVQKVKRSRHRRAAR